ncbi:hypothetical protein LCL97_19235 [Seohaeicola saemankumensis]|nr:hypothetical protein [Seohaeicola saemankumensis]MCA0872968.1 hypothetical protein [Seohaeicola saemankumensis]
MKRYSDSSNLVDGVHGWPAHSGEPPFICVDLDAGQPRFKGQANCELGSPIRNPATGQDEGVFARWHWCGDRLTAHVDPLGFFSLFYWVSGNRLLLSPSILQLIAMGADCDPDDRALSVFYRLGLFLNEDTPFRNIKVLPPGGRLEWHNGATLVHRADWPVSEQPVKRDAAIDGIIELPRDALRNMLATDPGDTVLPLSGGRDSRHILLDLDYLDAPPVACATFQQPSHQLNSEASAARAICERLGVTHHILDRPRPASRDILRCHAMTSLCSDEHVQMMPMHDFLGSRPWTVMDGIGGDILTNPDDSAEDHYHRAQAGDFRAIATAMMDGHAGILTKPGYDGGPGALFSPDTRDMATQYLTETIAAYGDAPDPYQSFWFWHRTRREIGFVPSALFASASAVMCPYLDTRFVQFCLSLPYDVTRDQQLHNAAIARAYPQVADVAYGNSFAAPPPARVSIAAKLERAIGGISTLLALQPDHPLAEIRRFLCGSRMLHRRPAEVFQMYSLMLSGMNAEFARHILQLSAQFAKQSTQNQVTRSYEPETTS